MENNRNSYANILKSIGLFGGAKVFQILVGILKNKVVAILLGPTGMGISGMITNNTQFISSLTGFGLQTSSVREIANATASGDQKAVAKTVSVLNKLVWFTGFLGLFVTFLLAEKLSVWSFQTTEYTWGFRAVSIILLLDQLCIGQIAQMQGTFKYKHMTKASLWGSLIGLIVAVPLYYLWGFKAIIPVIISNSVVNLILSSIYSWDIIKDSYTITIKEVIMEGRWMLSLGFALALSGVVGIGVTYLLRIFISNYGSLEDVGLYTAGITISTQYINIILTSMGSDYSPRLASLANNNESFIDAINKQMQLLIVLITPCVILFFILIRELTILLYSSQFIAITGMIEWMMVGMFFRAISWSMSYAVVAKGNTKVFFGNELLSCLCTLSFSIVGYWLYGFNGLGIAFCLTYILYTIQMYIVCKNQFNFYVDKKSYNIVLIQLLSMLSVFVTVKLLGYCNGRYIVGSLLFVIELLITYKQLSKMINMNSILIKLKIKK